MPSGETHDRSTAEVVPIGTSRQGFHQTGRQAFLKAMRQVATSVTVVTTDGPAGRHGATVSAFVSVSADPPTVLVCLRSDSRTCAAIQRNRNFTVSVLTEQFSEVAQTFAGKFDASLADRFNGINIESFPDLAPGIQGASIFACAVAKLIEQHTHTIVIGHVEQVAAANRPPLLYHCGAYGRVSPCEDAQSA